MKPFFRRRFIVDAKFQWAVICYTFVISLCTTVAQSTVARLRMLDESHVAVRLGNFQMDPRTATWVLYAVCYVGMFALAVLFSNRLAGPLFRLRNHMDDVTKGKAVKDVHFRKGDYYSELSDSYNKLLASVAKRKTGEKGFSLIELMVVVAIASVLATISIASFVSGPTENAQFKQEVISLKDILVTARNIAVAKNQCAFVTIGNPTKVIVRTYVMPNVCTGALPAAFDTEIIRDFSPNINITDFDVGPILVFRPSGGTTLSAPAVLSLNGPDGRQQRITIYPAIGQVRLM